MKKNILALSLFILGWTAPLSAEVMTYQGRLKESNVPVNANRSFLFEFCATETPTGCVASPDGAKPFAVQNGLFKSTFTMPAVDLSAGPWYLRVKVEGSYLSPVERLTFVPYSLYASSAGYSAAALQKAGDTMTGHFTSVSSVTITGNGGVYGLQVSSNVSLASALYSANGNVGIGTTGPGYLLDVAGNARFTGGSAASSYMDGSISVQDNLGLVARGNLNPSLNRWSLRVRGTGTEGDFDIYDVRNGSSRLLINSTGSIGIGTTGPGYRLHVSSGAGETGMIMAVSTGTTNIFSVDGYGVNALKFTGDGSGLTGITGAQGTDNSKVLKAGDTMTGQLTLYGSTLTVGGNEFSVAGSTFVVKNGRVGVGTAAPIWPLHVNMGGYGSIVMSYDDTPTGWGDIAFVDNTSSNRKWGVGVLADSYPAMSNSWYVWQQTDKNESAVSKYRLVVNDKGYVGISSDTPKYLLVVSSGAGETGVIMAVSTGATNVFSVDGYGVTALKFTGDGSGLTGVTGASGTDSTRVLKAGDTMTGSLLLDAGSTITVTGSAFSVGGSTLVVKGGYVGLGTDAPAARLHVVSDNGYVHFASPASGLTVNMVPANYTPAILNNNASGPLVFSIDNDQKVVMTQQTLVGIGTAVPSYRLHVSTPAGETGVIMAVSTGATNVFSVDGYGVTALKFTGDGSGLTGVTGASGTDSTKVLKAGDTMTGQLTNTSSVTVTGNGGAYGLEVSSNVSLAGALYSANGNVGVGTNSPQAKLQVNGDVKIGSSLQWSNSSNQPMGRLNTGSDAYGYLDLTYGGSTNVHISGSGPTFFSSDNVGIWTAAPDQRFTVVGNISQTGVLISSGSGDNYFAGNIGISTGIPQARLDVLAGGSAPTDMATIWRNSAGTIVSSVSATGVVTGSKFVGDGSGLTGLTAGAAGTATNLAGGAQGEIPYQTGVSNTAMLAAGTAGQLLQTNGTGAAPSWTSAPAMDGSNIAGVPAASLAAGSLPADVIASSVAFNSVYDSALVTPKVSRAGDTMTGQLTKTTSVTIIGNGGGAYGLQVSSNVSLAGALYSANGNVGVGTASPEQVLTIRGNSSDLVLGLSRAGGTFPTILKQGSDNALVISNDNADALILKSGKVGIGTLAPDQKLTVAGSISQTGVLLSSGTGDSYFAGRVGVGIQTVGPQLEVLSQSDTPGTLGIGIRSGNNANRWGFRNDFTNGNFHIDGYNSGWADRLTILKSNGNVGIGTAAPDQKLTVAGNISQTGVLISSGAGMNYFAGDVTAARYQVGGSTVLAVLPGLSSLGVGLDAGPANVGDGNLFVGISAGKSNGSGGSNSFVGTEAGYTNTTGLGNSFVGYYAGRLNNFGGNNTIVGSQAGLNNDGDNNSFFGRNAGAANSTGDNNVFIGAQAGANATGTNNIVIGYNKDTSQPIANDELNIGGVLYGDLSSRTIGISTRVPQAALDIVSTGTVQTQFAQIWRDSNGNIQSSMSATGVMMASKFVGDGSGLTGVYAPDATKLPLSGGNLTGSLTLSLATMTITRAGGTAFTVDSSGHVGINAFPDASAGLYLGGAGTYEQGIKFGSMWALHNNSNILTITKVSGATYSVLNINSSGDTAVLTGKFTVGGSTLAVVNRTVGINLAAPQAALDIVSTATASNVYAQIWRDGAGVVTASVTSQGRFSGDGSGLTGVSAVDSSKLPLAGGMLTGGLTVTGASITVNSSDGQLMKLNSNATYAGVSFYYNDTTQNGVLGFGNNGGIFIPAINGAMGLVGYSGLHLGATSKAALTITTLDKVGIGTISPLYALDISTANDTDAYVFRAGVNGILVSTGGAVTTTGVGNGTVAGNARGNGAVDLQTRRSAGTQVASGEYSVIGGGTGNTAINSRATVSGGSFNVANGPDSTVGGGTMNQATNTNATVAGGLSNTASIYAAAVGGGAYNSAAANYAVVSGGNSNWAQGENSAITGGGYNVVSGSNSFIGSGVYNTVIGTSSVVSGGENNKASGMWSAVGGGRKNTAGSLYSSVAGGYSNVASGDYAMVSGGRESTALGQYSWAGGYLSSSTANGSFTWADSLGAEVRNTIVDRTVFKNRGGLMVTSLTGVLADNLGMLDVVSTATAAGTMAQVWRNNSSVVVGSMSSTGVMMAVKFVGDGSGLTSLTGDNLGNHTATQALQMGSYGINTSSDITAARYQINGSTALALTGTRSLGVGSDAGRGNASTNSVFVGDAAGLSNTLGHRATFVGADAGRANLAAANNSYFGYGAGYAGTGAENTAAGAYALWYNVTGEYNVAMGVEAGLGTGVGQSSISSSTLVGYRAGTALQNGTFGNVLLGFRAGDNLNTGSRNIIIGYDQDATAPTISDELNIGGLLRGNLAAGSIGIGFTNTLPLAALDVRSTSTASNVYAQVWRDGAGAVVASMASTGNLEAARYQINGSTMLAKVGSTSIAVGPLAGQVNTAANNTFVGHGAGSANTSGSGNVFVGDWAGSASTGGQNTFVGSNAGITNTTGGQNTFVGQQAGYFNLGGAENSFFGAQAGNANNSGGGNSYFGYYAGRSGSGTNSAGNSFFGNYSGGDNTSGGQNVFMGVWSGRMNTTGSNNVYIGAEAARFNQQGAGNVFIGYHSGGYGPFVAFNSSSSTLLGYEAGHSLATGSADNIFIGFRAGYDVSTGTGNIVIGYGKNTSAPAANNQLNIGGLIHGRMDTGYVGIGVANPVNLLDLAGPDNSVMLMTTPGATFRVNAGSYGAELGMVTSDVLTILTGNLPRVTVLADGKVGINTTTPGEQLVVNGAIKVGTTAGANSGTIRFNGTNFQGYDGALWKNFDVSGGGWTNSGGNIYPGTLTDNVGVGIVPAGHKLQVYDNVTAIAQHGVYSKIYPNTGIPTTGKGFSYMKAAMAGVADSNGAVSKVFGLAGYLNSSSQTDSAGVLGAADLGSTGDPARWGALGYRETGGMEWAGYFYGPLSIYNRLPADIATVKALSISGNANFKIVTDWYGLYIDPPADASNVVNRYALVTQPAAGNVGIGTLTPGTKLEVSDTNTHLLTLYRPTQTLADKVGLVFQMRDSATNPIYYGAVYGEIEDPNWSNGRKGALAFYTNNDTTLSEKMRITNGGRVGIGTSLPRGVLEIQSNTTSQLVIGGSAIPYYPADTFGGINDSNALVIHAAGVLGDKSYVDFVGMGSDSGNYGSVLNFWTKSVTPGTDPVKRMTIADWGDVGISTGTPKSRLQVNGDLGLGDGTETANQPVVVWLKNGTGGVISANRIVVAGPADNTFALPAGGGDEYVLGVTYEAIGPGVAGRIAVAGVVNVQLSATPAATRGYHVTALDANGFGNSVVPAGFTAFSASIGRWLASCPVSSLCPVLLK